MSAPMTFFSYFAKSATPIEFVGLISAAVVKWNDYESTKSLIGVRESFERRDEIDIIVTSLAGAGDKHGLLNVFLQGGPTPKVVEKLRQRKWRGDLQFRPYSDEKPLDIDTGVKAVSLFELSELVEIVAKQRDRYCIVVCGPCNRCLESKAKALYPLITAPALAVANHVVTDTTTAQELLDLGKAAGRPVD